MATYTGTSGNDTFTGGAEADSASGLAGNDTLRGGAGDDTLLGGDGSDHLHGDDGNDSLLGGAGNDNYFGGAGNDFFDGGSITDRTNYTDLNALDYRATIFDAGGVVVNLSGITGDAGTGSGTVAKGAGGALGTDTVANVNFVIGSHGNDRITLSTAIIFENVNGTLGNDTIDGGANENRFFPAFTNRISYTTITGPVTIDLRAGTVVKPTGTDSITNFTLARGSSQDDQIYGSDDPVRAEWFYGEGGSDTIDGRGGFDYVRYDLIPGTSGVSIRLDTSDPQPDGQGGSDRLFNIEGIIGSPNADVFTGNAQVNRLDGRGGDDTIDGGPGNDVIDGGANVDTASYATAPAGVVAIIIGSGGGATGGGGTDVFFNIENLIGSPSADTLVGASTGSRLEGGAGNDSISGSSGASDALVGGPGDDTLDGGAITDRAGYTDSNQASYAAATTGVVVSLAGVTGIGSTGSGTAEDGEGGTDVLRHINMIEGSAHDDRITGSSALQFEVFIGGLGNDTIDGGSLADPLQRALNRANYAAATNPVTVNLAAGTTSGAHGNDVLININGVQTGSGADTLLGSDRSDVTEQFAGGAGADSIDGRGGIDFLRYDTGGAGGALTIDLQDGISSDGDVFVNIEGVYGSSFNDTIFGREAAPDTIMGMGGNDSIDGGAGPGDVVWYFRSTAGINLTLPGNGSSTASDGHGGTDTLVGIEGVRGSHHADTLTGSTLQETFEGSVGNDTIDGGSNFDTTSYELSWYQGAVVDLSAGIAHDDGFGNTDTLISIENVTGTLIYGDRLTGTNSTNLLRGLGGDDTLLGLAGSDTLEPGSGVDSVDAGTGYDTLRLAGARAAYTVSVLDAGDTSGNGRVRLVNAVTQEDVSVRSVEQVAFNDVTVTLGSLLGGGATPYADSLAGSGGADTIDGLAGSDDLFGLAGNDSLAGNDGDDLVEPGTGVDMVDGGEGLDRVNLLAARGSYTITQPTAGALRLVNSATDEDVTIVNVERVRFSNGTFNVGELFGGANTATEFADSLTGTSGNDTLDGLGSTDGLNGGNGDDVLIGGSGDDLLTGGNGNDTAAYDSAPSSVSASLQSGEASGGAGRDIFLSGIENLRGSAFGDTLTGDAGNNLLVGLAGDDSLAGGAGNDTFNGGAGNDHFTGGAGIDVISYAEAPAAITVSAATSAEAPGTVNDGQGGTDRLDWDAAERIIGSAFADEMNGAGAADAFDGGDGNDTLRGNAGADSLTGGDGNDLVLGGDGSDDLDAALRGANDDDTLIGGAGDDTLEGGSGFDYADYGAAPGAVTIDLAAGTASDGQGGTDRLTSIEIVSGSSFADRLTGDAHLNAFAPGPGNDTVTGGGSDGAVGDVVIYDEASGPVLVNLAAGSGGGADQGNDTLIGIRGAVGSDHHDTLIGSSEADYLDGSSGNDSLSGADSNDTLRGDLGNDTLDGGAGIDRATYSASGAGVSVNLASGSNSGGDGADTLRDIEELEGSTFNDTLTGDGGNNVIIGREGADSLRGGDGDDSILGGAGRDTLRGDGGNDTLDGGYVSDRINYTDLNFIGYADESGGVRIDLSAISGDGSVGFGTVTKPGGAIDRIANFPILQASNHADTIIGSSSFTFEQFEGRAGDDDIDGGTIDPIFGRGSNRVSYENSPLPVLADLAAGSVSGGDGTDRLSNINMLRGSAYNDTLYGSAFGTLEVNEQFEGRGGSDLIDGRGGFDVARYENSPSGVVANLKTGIAHDGWGFIDTLVNIEGLRGSPFDDLLVGGLEANGDTFDGLRSSNHGNERFAGGAGNDTLDGGVGYDRAIYFNAPAGVTVTLGGSANGSAQDGEGGTDTLIAIEGAVGSRFADRLSGSAGAFWEIFVGLDGDDTISGGDMDRVSGLEQFDAVDYRIDDGGAGVVVNLQTGSAVDGFGDTDTLTGIEFVFGSHFADSVRGADGPATRRGETVRGGAGNDTIDGGTGVDAAEFLGRRADYELTRINPSTWTVRDINLADGDEGTDTLTHVERVVFNDEMLSFGTRAEEMARVAAVLWTKPIITSTTLFSIGYSFYDNGDGDSYTFDQMVQAALTFWTGFNDAQLAARLKEASGTAKTEAQLLATMAAAGGSVAGRVAAVREAALDPVMDTWVAMQGLQTAGVVSVNFVNGFGQLFDLWAG